MNLPACNKWSNVKGLNDKNKISNLFVGIFKIISANEYHLRKIDAVFFFYSICTESKSSLTTVYIYKVTILMVCIHFRMRLHSKYLIQAKRLDIFWKLRFLHLVVLPVHQSVHILFRQSVLHSILELSSSMQLHTTLKFMTYEPTDLVAACLSEGMVVSLLWYLSYRLN